MTINSTKTLNTREALSTKHTFTYYFYIIQEISIFIFLLKPTKNEDKCILLYFHFFYGELHLMEWTDPYQISIMPFLIRVVLVRLIQT